MNKTLRIVIIAALAVVFAGAIVIREGQRRSAASAAAQASAQGSATQTAQGQTLPRLVDLGSTTCVPCKMMAPLLDELSKEYPTQFVVEVIDVRANRTAAELYGVRVIPTQIFIDAAGQELFRHEGFMAKDAILSKWTELGLSLKGPAGAEG